MVLQAGAYGPHHEFGEVSRQTGFYFGDGLPGSVWSSGKPQVWDDLEASHFVRLTEARRAGLDAGLGIPIRAGGQATNGVAVLLCGSRTSTGGCIERWDVDRDVRELRHAGGYYGHLEPFARMSPQMSFPVGHGLPGITWKRGLPTILADTRDSDSFLRAEIARECGVEAGIGIPIYRGGEIEHVVVLLSAEATPLAKVFEVWVPSRPDTLRLDQAFYARGLETFAKSSRQAKLKTGHGLVGRAYQTELPQVFGALEGSPFVRHDAAVEAGLQVGIGIPIHDGRNVIAVVLLLS